MVFSCCLNAMDENVNDLNYYILSKCICAQEDHGLFFVFGEPGLQKIMESFDKALLTKTLTRTLTLSDLPKIQGIYAVLATEIFERSRDKKMPRFITIVTANYTDSRLVLQFDCQNSIPEIILDRKTIEHNINILVHRDFTFPKITSNK